MAFSVCILVYTCNRNTFVVIHYFEYVISNKHYFVLHLFFDSTSTPIHYILHLLFHLSQCLLFFLLVVGWASRLFFLFIILWLSVWANPLLPSYLLFPISVSCPKFVTDVYYWEVSARFCVYLLSSKSKVPRLSFEPEPNSNSRVARRALGYERKGSCTSTIGKSGSK